MNKLMLTLMLAADNPYSSKLINMLGDIKGWILGTIAAITGVVIAVHGVKYQQGDGQEKAEATKNIKKTAIMGGGIFFLVWFGTYVATTMAG